MNSPLQQFEQRVTPGVAEVDHSPETESDPEQGLRQAVAEVIPVLKERVLPTTSSDIAVILKDDGGVEASLEFKADGSCEVRAVDPEVEGQEYDITLTDTGCSVEACEYTHGHLTWHEVEDLKERERILNTVKTELVEAKPDISHDKDNIARQIAKRRVRLSL